ncbi:ABC transporter substrate-binding protein [Bacillus sp. J14TS2]|uniref:extracellular solute-binding protein n=1 Tax=Bacillus sp. J14TS2 TaxID=2807188 RepID=UPI001B1321A5|nr:extracellular solute-binding protein [Bacillus sp. J14TS2]GIN69691.1 ABC transporter substrate-binding protein [Bacillus sp. J14TS2]
MKKLSWLILVLLLTFSMILTACTGGDSEKTSKESDKTKDGKLSLHFMKRGFGSIHPPADELWMWKKMEEMTGIHIDWEEVPDESRGEKKNVIMSSKELPDAFYGSFGFSADEVAKYGQEGLFIPLEDLIEEHAPNLTALFEENPSIKQAVTMPDGHIYSLPYVDFSGPERSLRYNINAKWLENIGIDDPTSITTLDQFTDALRKFKSEDANGNGDADDEVPISIAPGQIGMFEEQMLGAFGMGNGGLKAAGMKLYLDENDELQLTLTDDKFKSLWSYFNMLWEEDLFHPQTFSDMEYEEWVTEGTQDKVGVFSWAVPDYLGSKVAENFVGLHAFEGENGDRVLNWIDHPARGTAQFMITKDNQSPEETIKWVDFFYGEEGSNFGYFGIEGETYEMVDGAPLYSDEILNYDGGVQLGAFQFVDNVYGAFYPYVEPEPEWRAKARGVEIDDIYNANTEEIEALEPETILPQFQSTAEESAEISAIMTDIDTYVEEMRAKFVTGKADIETGWEEYVNSLKKMGIDRYLEIRRSQYERIQNQ